MESIIHMVSNTGCGLIIDAILNFGFQGHFQGNNSQWGHIGKMGLK